jgi:hypothetical protein
MDMQYTFMNKNTPILTCEIDSETDVISKITSIQNPEYLPIVVRYQEQGIGVKRGLYNWWKNRSIPASRQGLAAALLELDIPYKEQLLLKGLGLSLSDQYWMNPNGELFWKDVNFFDHSFSEDVGNALFGKSPRSDELNLMSPDNTSDGWLKKRWKIIDNQRCLIKGGSEPFMQQPVNEVISSHILGVLNGCPFVPYSLLHDDGGIYSVCKNFITPNTEFVSAWQIYQIAKKDNRISKYDHFLACCDTLGIHGMKDFLDYMLSFDYIIANTDRHLNNFGMIRDVNTLHWIGPAPIFDNGTSLWCKTLDSGISPRESVVSTPFHGTNDKQLDLVSAFHNLDIAKLKHIAPDLEQVFRQSSYIGEERRGLLCSGIMTRIQLLENEMNRR